jgi:FkbM family methyltransferase
VAKSFSDSNISEWMWESLEQGQPRDLRFEQLMPRSPRDIVAFIEPPAPDDIYREYVPVHHVMRRLWLQGLRPDFIIDVGASHGIWSHAASTVFPDARFVLIDPLMSKYDRSAVDHHLRKIRRVEVLEIAVSNQVGRASFHVSEDLYGSSLFRPADFRSYDSCEVDVDTLDNIARKMGVEGRGILKLDVQCAEHIVLDGARELLARVDGVVAEISLVRYDSQALVLSEMLQLLKGLGYRYYDDTGFWRSPIDGTLLQKEILFLKNDLCVPETSREIVD